MDAVEDGVASVVIDGEPVPAATVTGKGNKEEEGLYRPSPL